MRSSGANCPSTDNARVLAVRRYLNLIDARYLNGRWKGIEATRCFGIIQEVQNRPNGEVVSPGVVGSTRTGVRRHDTWEDINAKDALVSPTTCKMANSIFDSLTIVFETFQTPATERPDVTVHILMTG